MILKHIANSNSGKGIKMPQIKINIEIKVSKNYNTATLGVQDQPIAYENVEELRKKIKAHGKILREEAEYQLSLIGSKPEAKKE